MTEIKETIEYMCEGCDRVNHVTLVCGVYVTPPSAWVRRGCCPFNRKIETKKKRVRVGQQKQRKLR